MLTAARDGWRLRLYDGGDPIYAHLVTTVRVERRPTVLAVLVTVLAWLLGCAAGALKPDRLSIGFVGPLLLGMNTIVATVAVIAGVVRLSGTASFPPPWRAFELFLMRPLSVAGVLLVGLFLVTTPKFRDAAARRARALRGR